jgi:hypothetical protein
MYSVQCTNQNYSAEMTLSNRILAKKQSAVCIHLVSKKNYLRHTCRCQFTVVVNLQYLRHTCRCHFPWALIGFVVVSRSVSAVCCTVCMLLSVGYDIIIKQSVLIRWTNQQVASITLSRSSTKFSEDTYNAGETFGELNLYNSTSNVCIIPVLYTCTRI